MAEYTIPEVTDERLARYAHIKALKRTDGGYKAAPEHDVRGFSWPWIEEGWQENPGPLKEKTRIRTLHSYGYYGFFKPSVAEVIAQATDEELDGVVGFATIGPSTAEDLNKEREALNAGVHVAETILFYAE